MKFELYRDSKREWRWRLFAVNGRNIANSGEGYRRKAGALKAIGRICADAQRAKIEVAE